jgi:hypothetical protein
VSGRLLLGLGRYMIPLPGVLWQRQVRGHARATEAKLAFMSDEHHLVRDFAVRELLRLGEPMSAGFIAEKLNLPVAWVESILDELARHMTFVCRDEQGAVAWAYPVTVETTPHHVTFSTGEQGYAA